MSKKKLKFKDVWANQTDIGKLFGLSSIKIGEMLTGFGLKDPNTKKATERATKEGFARETPLKDGTYFCMWHKQKVKSLLSNSAKPLTEEEIYINDAIKRKRDIEKMWNDGQDKLAYIMMDTFYDDIPKEYRPKIREIIDRDKQAYI